MKAKAKCIMFTAPSTLDRNIFPEKELKTLQMFVDQMVYLPIQSVPASFFKKLI